MYIGFQHFTEEFVRSGREKVVSGEWQSESGAGPQWSERFQEKL